jgi:hypothetical protein
MKYINENYKYFSTSNFYCAVFLSIKGLQLIIIDWTNSSRAQFVFIDIPEREELIKQFNYSEKNFPAVMVDAREYETAVKLLKDRLYRTGGEHANS